MENSPAASDQFSEGAVLLLNAASVCTASLTMATTSLWRAADTGTNGGRAAQSPQRSVVKGPGAEVHGREELSCHVSTPRESHQKGTLGLATPL